MKISSKSPETILREALEVARDELKRVNDHYSCVRPDPFGVVLDALQKVPALPPIPHASDVERRIVGKLVRDILDRDLTISVFDGEETTVRRSRDADTIFKALASTDEDVIIVHRNDSPVRVGSIWLVWGNDAHVISNNTDNDTINDLLNGAQALAEELGA